MSFGGSMPDDIDWHEYFVSRRIERQAINAEAEAKSKRHESVIIVPGREATPEEIITPARQLIKHCESRGMVVKCGYAVAVAAANRMHDEINCEGSYVEAVYVEAVYPKQLRMRATWEWNGTSRTPKGAKSYSSKGVQMKTFARGEDGKRVMQVIDLTVTEFKKLTGG
jgi:hypothetical protein